MQISNFLFPLLFLLFSCKNEKGKSFDQPSNLLTYVLNPKTNKLKMYWKDGKDQPYSNFQNLKEKLKDKGQDLLFAMNGGMYNKDQSPQGLYIEEGQLLSPIDTQKNGYGNFYLQPNGIFFLKDKEAGICKTENFNQYKNIQYATQSGPMLIIDGKLHPKFNEGSPNLHIRNGVGLLEDGQLLFAMSKEKINFFDFATFFKNAGCENALYLDGFVSRAYLPAKKWIQEDGNFGVIIAQTK